MYPVYAVIPARAGSRRLQDKNLRPVAGTPLLAWAIRQGTLAREITDVVVSTDSARYARLARAWGGRSPFHRAARYATSNAPTESVLLDMADRSLWPNDAGIVLLQPTSPLRTSVDIDACVRLWIEGGRRGAVISARPASREEGNAWRARTGRPSPAWGIPNGAVYVTSCGELRRARTVYAGPIRWFRMPRSRSVDIDTLEDLVRAEAAFRRAG